MVRPSTKVYITIAIQMLVVLAWILGKDNKLMNIPIDEEEISAEKKQSEKSPVVKGFVV